MGLREQYGGINGELYIWGLSLSVRGAKLVLVILWLIA